MNIITDQLVAEIRKTHIVLELDTFRSPDSTIKNTVYCVLEGIDHDDLPQLYHWIELHQNLIKYYRERQWAYCRQAIEHLQGRWLGQMDSFYHELDARIRDLETQDLDASWDGTIVQEHSVLT